MIQQQFVDMPQLKLRFAGHLTGYTPEISQPTTPPKKTAIFEAGDTFSKPSFLGIYVKFWGGIVIKCQMI